MIIMQKAQIMAIRGILEEFFTQDDLAIIKSN